MTLKISLPHILLEMKNYISSSLYNKELNYISSSLYYKELNYSHKMIEINSLLQKDLELFG